MFPFDLPEGFQMFSEVSKGNIGKKRVKWTQELVLEPFLLTFMFFLLRVENHIPCIQGY